METIDLKDKKVTSIDIFPDKVVINMGYEFKIGDYVTIETPPEKLIGILKNTLTIGNEGFPIFAGLGFSKDLYINSIFGVWPKNIVRKSTIEEIRQLNSALKRINKRWNPERKCLEDLPQYKEPIIGKPAIFWNDCKEYAIVDILLNKKEHYYRLYDTKDSCYRNAILCESLEQYLEFIKS